MKVGSSRNLRCEFVQKKGSSIGNFGISKLMTSLHPDGTLRFVAQFFNAVADSKGRERKCLGLAPRGTNTVESKFGSNPSNIGVTFGNWLHETEGAMS